MSEGGQPVQEVSQEEQDIARTATEFPDQPHRGGPLSGQTECPARVVTFLPWQSMPDRRKRGTTNSAHGPTRPHTSYLN